MLWWMGNWLWHHLDDKVCIFALLRRREEIGGFEGRKCGAVRGGYLVSVDLVLCADNGRQSGMGRFLRWLNDWS